MGGFEFGEISYLDPTKTLFCFIMVICFVVAFDVTIGVMEYYLEGSPIYNRMVQTIYKELMLMGVVSFIIIMVRAGRLASNYATAESGAEWVLGIDYAHIVLFFLTVFFVLHALYFMKKSLSSNATYRRKYTKEVAAMIKELDVVETNAQASFFYYLQYLPFSQLRDQVEFYLMVSLFRDTYWLPLEFNFADYLSGCFSRYSLKTIDRSFYSWLVILVIVVLNFGRVMLGFEFNNCRKTIHGDHTDDHHDDDDHHRRLSGGAVPEHKNTECVLSLVKLFLICAAALCLYTFIMMLICRLYKIRLIYRIGFESPGDYNEFLKFTQKQDEKVCILIYKPVCISYFPVLA
ncbi:hypothetical protein EON65_11870 [archaeon]|nr:MAG: hypothetical protein EON65_11870 [archaeon]